MGTSTAARRSLVALISTSLSLFISLATVVALAAPAHAEDGYRYWNYSHLEGDTFEFAQTGPADFTPEDGAVEGWRFGTSTVSTGLEPRADLAEVSFDTVCRGTEAGAGQKRVALLIDYGVDADADGATAPEPVAECAVVPEDANGQQTLESVVDVRSEDALICALNGYPVKGCGDPVPNADVAQDESTVAFELPQAATAASAPSNDASPAAADVAVDEEPGGIGWPLVAVLVLAALLAAVAVPLYRRNRES